MVVTDIQPLISETDEVQSLRYQLQTLKEMLHAAKMQVPSGNDESPVQRRLKEVVAENERHKLRIERLTAGIVERDQKNAELQRITHVLSERTRESLQGLQQAQEALKLEALARQEAADEVLALQGQFATLKAKIGSLHQQVSQYETEIQRLQKEYELVNGLHEQAVHALKNANERLSVLQKEFDETESKLQTTTADKQQLIEELTKTKHAQEEAEARLKFAQYHLAKKVKEATEMSDDIQAKTVSLRDLEGNFNLVQTKNAELQNILDEREGHEKRLQEQWQDSMKAAEDRLESWEQKYSKLHERWQEDLGRLKELYKIADKYQQLQMLWMQFNRHFTESPELRGVSSDLIVEPSKQAEIEETFDLRRPYQNLFDLSIPRKSK